MLVLSRKTHETIVIGSDIQITVVSVSANRVKIGIQAPDYVRVLRSELLPPGEGRSAGSRRPASR